MKRVSLAILGASGLAISLVGLSLIAHLNLDEALERYPGSMRVTDERVQFNSIGQSTISRQATYQTAAELLTVRRWYASRYPIDPALERNLAPIDNCVWLGQSKRILWVEHSMSVLLCSRSHGTRIFINESVSLPPCAANLQWASGILQGLKAKSASPD